MSSGISIGGGGGLGSSLDTDLDNAPLAPYDPSSDPYAIGDAYRGGTIAPAQAPTDGVEALDGTRGAGLRPWDGREDGVDPVSASAGNSDIERALRARDGQAPDRVDGPAAEAKPENEARKADDEKKAEANEKTITYCGTCGGGPNSCTCAEPNWLRVHIPTQQASASSPSPASTSAAAPTLG